MSGEGITPWQPGVFPEITAILLFTRDHIPLNAKLSLTGCINNRTSHDRGELASERIDRPLAIGVNAIAEEQEKQVQQVI